MDVSASTINSHLTLNFCRVLRFSHHWMFPGITFSLQSVLWIGYICITKKCSYCNILDSHVIYDSHCFSFNHSSLVINSNTCRFTTRTSKGHGVSYFHEQIKIPFGNTLDIIGVDTGSLQVNVCWIYRILYLLTVEFSNLVHLMHLLYTGANISVMQNIFYLLADCSLYILGQFLYCLPIQFQGTCKLYFP